MREFAFTAEVDRCREMAREYDGRPEGVFLASVAQAFEELERQPPREAVKQGEGIRLFV
jgi:hypothetical protein